MKIRIAGNTDGPCYFVIKSKGYKVEVTYDEGEDYSEFVAFKDKLEISATSMEELLGLICMYESRKENWTLTDAEYKLYLDIKYGDGDY